MPLVTTMQNVLSAYADGEKSDVVRSLKALGGIRDLGSRDDHFETTVELYQRVCTGFHLYQYCHLDVCASHSVSKCEVWINERDNALKCDWKNFYSQIAGLDDNLICWCNPPRSKNGKFVNKIYREWDGGEVGIVALLCWNDLGAKYGQRLFREIQKGRVLLQNLGKVSFLKDGKKTPYASRLSYFAVYFPPKLAESRTGRLA